MYPLSPPRVPLALFALVSIACDSYTTSPIPPPPPPSVQEGLWTASGLPSAILRLAPPQLLNTGAPEPATTLTTPSASLATLVGIAFDAQGTLWAVSADDRLLLGFAPGVLATSGAHQATTVIGPNAASLDAPTGLAFDGNGRLWVANHEGRTLVRFDPAQLAASGAPVPAVTLTIGGHPTSLALDDDGALWVSDNLAHTISKFEGAALAVSGAPAPSVVLQSNAFSLQNPSGLAFDDSGNLWVANVGGHTLVALSATQRVLSGAPVPHIRLTSTGGSLPIPVGLAFDSQGSLWVVGAAGAITMLTRQSLAVSGAPQATVRLEMTGHSIFWSAAFWPIPPGLPLR